MLHMVLTGHLSDSGSLCNSGLSSECYFLKLCVSVVNFLRFERAAERVDGEGGVVGAYGTAPGA